MLINSLTNDEIVDGFSLASKTKRKRYPKILHQVGDYSNRVLNFIEENSYMQPHLHPGEEKVEVIRVLKGSLTIIFFDNSGSISSYEKLNEGLNDVIKVPAFTWHTYVMNTKYVLTYETMNGIYLPDSWKRMAAWAPKEDDDAAIDYLNSLKCSIF